ncbi:MAG: methyltransferase [Chthonomonadetes bacterium]|jgi:tRNA (guanine26-N2/guanine27-N2)-dimethyltransferase|nr:methyltransferase [Chthonomonadetes bacterium]
MNEENYTELQEGLARFVVPQELFFNPRARLARDFGVIALRAEADLQERRLQVIDLMAGVGTRGIRYALEAPVERIVLNDGNPAAVEAIRRNIALNAISPDVQIEVTCEQVHRLCYAIRLRDEHFDWVDLDAFGSPSVYWHAASLAPRWGGVLYLTATDMAALCGKLRDPAVRHYGAVTRPWECGDEIGARVLLGALQQSAGERGLYWQPLFVLDEGYAMRIAVRLHYGSAEFPVNQIGWMVKCMGCYSQTTLPLHVTVGRCRVCGSEEVQWAGPLWTGSLYDAEFLHLMSVEARKAGYQAVLRQLRLMVDEASSPAGYYCAAELGKRTHLSHLPPVDALIQRLRQAGYEASRTHFETAAFKTNAPYPVIQQIAQQLQ